MSWEEITSSVVLEKDEKALNVWQGDVESTIKTVRSKRGLIRTKHKVVEAKDKETGALVLTNERLIPLKKRGVFSKSYHTTFEIPLQDVTGISETGRISKRVCVSDRAIEYRFRIGVGIEEFRNTV